MQVMVRGLPNYSKISGTRFNEPIDKPFSTLVTEGPDVMPRFRYPCASASTPRAHDHEPSRTRHAMILAFEKEQRPIVARDSVKHFAHDNGVIAAFVTLHNLALEIADSAV